MSKLILGLISNNNQLEKFHEIDMSWVSKFNEEFQKSEIPFKEQVYIEELLSMSSLAVLNEFMVGEEQFQVDRTKLIEILRKLFDYEQQQTE